MVNLYGLMFFLGLVLNFILWLYLNKEEKLEITLEYFIVGLIGIIVGARLFQILFYSPLYYFNNPIKIFLINEGGLASHGGFIVGTLVTYLYCKFKKINFWKMADKAILVIMLTAIFVRMGNFFNNEIIGRTTFNIKHPVQIYSAIKNTIVFFTAFVLYHKKMNDGFVFWFTVLLYSILRFFVEFFKEYMVFSQGLTIGQWFCLLFIIPSVIMSYKKFNKGNKK